MFTENVMYRLWFDDFAYLANVGYTARITMQIVFSFILKYLSVCTKITTLQKKFRIPLCFGKCFIVFLI